MNFALNPDQHKYLQVPLILIDGDIFNTLMSSEFHARNIDIA